MAQGKTFDTSKLYRGIGSLFKTVNYDKVAESNVYYRSLLRKSKVPQPKFVAEVNVDALKKKPNAKLTPHEKNFKALRPLTKLKAAPEKREEILSTFRRLTKQYPGDVNLNLLFARILINNDLYADATFYLHRATQQDEKCDFAWAHLALIAALAHDHGQAIYCARKALELGNHLYFALQKAFVFSLLLMGNPAKVGPFDSTRLFDSKPFSDAELGSPAPAIDYVHIPEKLHKQPVVMFGCDEGYFNRFAKNMLRSLVQGDTKQNIHIHLVNPSDDSLEWIGQFTKRHDATIIVSREIISPELQEIKAYLASCRFIVVPEFMEKFDRGYLVVDADTILNEPALLDSFFEQIKQPTIFYSFGPVWDTATAAFVFTPNTKVGHGFARKTQHFLKRMFFGKPSKSFWYIDQLALLGACLEHADDMLFAPAAQVSCIKCSEDSIFWFLSNDKEVDKYWNFCKQLEKDYP